MKEEKIQAKQVEGVVDTTTQQDINARKIFKAPQVFDKLSATFHIVPFQGFIYWVQNRDVLNQIGNFRIGVDKGEFVHQEYLDGIWFTRR
jgi:hypothetical protein